MPWTSGTYTRGYASWSNDAANNLPISATKFDLEDSDFAAGLNNCLTVDGLNLPKSALVWGQTNAIPLTLTRGSDGIAFQVGRTGGTYNPSFQVTLADASGITLGVSIAEALNLAINGANVYTISAIGAHSVVAPTAAAIALTVNGYAGSNVLTVASATGATTTAADFLISRAGSTINTVAQGPNLELYDSTNGNYSLLQNAGGQTELWQYNGGWNQILKVLTTRGITINAPASGATLSVSGYGGYTGLLGVGATLQVTGSGTTGIASAAGTEIYNTGTVGAIQAYNRSTSAYMPMYVSGSTLTFELGTTPVLSINAAGQMTLAAPTSSAAPALTINSYGSGGASALSITGQSPTNNYAELYMVRASTTANTQGYGPSIQFCDTAGACFGMVQFSGQQLEFWQFPTSGAWGQSAFFDSSRNLNINNGSGRSPVYSGVPQAGGASSNYTLVLGDANKFWLQNSGTAHTVTIPANASVAFPIGTVITFIGIAGSANTTISPSGGVTLLFVPTGTTGNRTLSGNGMATAIKVSTDYWVISGSGLT